MGHIYQLCLARWTTRVGDRPCRAEHWYELPTFGSERDPLPHRENGMESKRLLFGTVFVLGLVLGGGTVGSSPDRLPRRILPIVTSAGADSALTPFSKFGARAEIVLGIGSDSDCFELTAGFALGPGNDGIDPVTEPVTLSVGTGSWVLPPGSFHKAHPGRYVAERPIGRTLLMAIILRKVGDEFELRASGVRARIAAPASASYKPAKLETGLTVQVPPFIQTGDRIRVDKVEVKYLERVK